MKIDLHTHSSEYSACSVVRAVHLLEAARERGLDAIAITDHGHFLTESERDALELAVPGIRVFRGMEIGLRGPAFDGTKWEDVVIVGGEPCDDLHPLDWSNVDRLADLSRRTGALTILAHPYRYHDDLTIDLERFRPDAVEIASINVVAWPHDRIASLAAESGMQCVGTTDSHATELVGLHYIETDSDVRTERELAEAVRAGAYTIGSNEAVLAERERRVAALEELARAVREDGDDEAEFAHRAGKLGLLETGVWRLAARGLSARPNRRAMGMRGRAKG
jgi:hypothetical protein